MITNSYISISRQYFISSLILCKEIISSANNHFVITANASEIRSTSIKFTDSDIVLPLLFNFYHGTESFLKGLLATKNCTIENHKLSDLFHHAKVNFPEIIELGVFNRYLETNNTDLDLIKNLFALDNRSIDAYYEVLRYPENKNKSVAFNQILLMYKGIKGLPFYNIFESDITVIIDLVDKI